jgi:hypothetical protein
MGRVVERGVCSGWGMRGMYTVNWEDSRKEDSRKRGGKFKINNREKITESNLLVI